MTNDEAILTLQQAVDEAFGAGIEIITRDGCEAIEMAIEALQERKTGKWEIYVVSMLDGEGCRCSECGFEGAPYWHYCPGCGAKIEGVCKEER